MICLDEPEITASCRATVHQELSHYPFSTKSNTVELFEKVMCNFLGVDDCVAVNSGTSALHLVLEHIVRGKFENDVDIILPVLTFAATANAVKMINFKGELNIVFADVDFLTWNLTGKTIRNLFKENNVIAVIGVDLYGNSHGNIRDEIWNHNVVSDSAESLGAIGGVYWDYSCFSFNGNKILTTGAGGLIVGNDLKRIRIMANQGRNKDGDVVEYGYNYRMTGIQAALGLSQMLKLNKNLERKRKINEIYRNELSQLQFQKATEGTKSSWWMTAALFPDDIDIKKFQTVLEEKGVPTRRIFKPINQEPAYRDYKSYPNAEYIYNHGLCLPSSVKNTDDDINKVCKIIREYL